jgi:4-hydroxybenzoate polyprenyltransferase
MPGLAIFCFTAAALGLTSTGLLVKKRHPWAGVVLGAVAVLAAVGAWYAWGRTHEASWTLAYLLVSVLAGLTAVRHLSTRLM